MNFVRNYITLRVFSLVAFQLFLTFLLERHFCNALFLAVFLALVRFGITFFVGQSVGGFFLAFRMFFLDQIMRFTGLVIVRLESHILMSSFTLRERERILLDNEVSGKGGLAIKSLPEMG